MIGGKGMKIRTTVTVDPKLLKDAKEVLKDTGVTLSGFFSVTLQGLVDSNHKPMRQMYEDMAKNLIKQATRP